MSDQPWNLSYFRDPDFIEAPVATPATELADHSFVANWTGIEEAVGYELDVALDEEFADMVGTFDSHGPSYIVGDLDSATPYFYRVRAVKRSGTISASSNVIATETTIPFVGQGGDLVTYDGEFSRHYFDNDGDFEILEGEGEVRRLIVGGGGMGGGVNGSGVSCGGGGGGGVLDIAGEDRDPLGVGVYPVVVGEGGDTAGALNVGEDGHDSSFEGDVAEGGGHGGSAGANVGNGGSGGGATNSSGNNEQGGLGVVGQGNDGGDCPGSGGGGGAGGGGGDEVGGNGTIATGGKGGDGLESDISGEPVRYGAGGGGGRPVDPFGVIVGTTPGAGGAGGGGNGAGVTPANGGAGTGIGAGGGGALGNRAGGVGTKGQVVLKYRGRAADITIIDPPVDPPVAMWRGPILGPGVIDGVTIDIAYYEAGPGGEEMHSTDNPVLGQKHTPGEPNSFDDGFPYPAYYATNSLGFKFSHEVRRFRITRKNASGVIRHQIFAADTGGDEAFYGEGYAANGGVTNSGSKYLKFFGVGADNRQEVAWVSMDSFKVVIVQQTSPAWGDGSSGYPDAMALVPDIYYDAYFLLASDVEAPDEDLWEPP